MILSELHPRGSDDVIDILFSFSRILSRLICVSEIQKSCCRPSSLLLFVGVRDNGDNQDNYDKEEEKEDKQEDTDDSDDNDVKHYSKDDKNSDTD
ncbi:hypothetical protein CHS0354_039891 [Potamilus streckersoni]|uniref:Uncharacterized protein n=1 Tax=Potamilus streckersoni TaxID=2493646 RepID=A0AAE0THJ8_9BIVA|nr:hypothetical protein CHS0354_039891 [Potamilus streckersoni]